MLALFGLTALAACASSVPQERSAWRMTQDAGGAFLFFGITDSDDYSVGMSCKPGDGAIRVHQTFDVSVGERLVDGRYVDARGRPEPWPAVMGLTVGKQGAQANGEATIDELNSGLDVHATFDATDALWTAFASGGELVLTAHGHRETVEAGPVEDDARRRFVTDCRRS